MIKNAKSANDVALETMFKPIVDPLNRLANKPCEKQKINEDETEQYHSIKRAKYSESESSNSQSEDYEESVDEEENSTDDVFRTSDKTLTTSPPEEHNVSENSFKSLQSSPSSVGNASLSWSTSSDVMKDVPYGVRNERGKLMLGKSRVYDDGRTLKIGNRVMENTQGLKELLYKKIPNLDIVSKDDLENYKLLLIDTNAHRRNWDASKPVNSNKGFKYTNVIKPLFKFARNVTSSMESVSQGRGIDILKKVKSDTDLVYWDDPNELVERLKLLLASREAGNTGVDNEIYAIIEELSEAGIINVKYKHHQSA
ncbi:uncharacterized protein LOC114364575 [Ostrinia furnacalis]|uniref:uncharacterized protein LOC114364575 n=1 Tax=Ostrinia furnacalis TaxID=93504 RepID=UPI00103BC938|nr:uncharacterized protein LOC114364575 [Ostrinia furnacalis]